MAPLSSNPLRPARQPKNTILTSAGRAWVALLLALAYVPFGTVLHGWALSVLWRWFMVPTFGLPPLSIPAALGVASVWRLFTIGIAREKTNEEETVTGDNVFSVLSAILLKDVIAVFITLGIARIILAFM